MRFSRLIIIQLMIFLLVAVAEQAKPSDEILLEKLSAIADEAPDTDDDPTADDPNDDVTVGPTDEPTDEPTKEPTVGPTDGPTKPPPECITDDDCNHIKNSECTEEKCVCKTSYFFNKNKDECLIGVGATCSKKEDCEDIDGAATCEGTDPNKVCTCPDSTYGSYDFKNCYKMASESDGTWTCEDNNECGFINDDGSNTTSSATCVEKKCTCANKDWFIYSAQDKNENNFYMCARLLGAECDYNEQCYEAIENSVCANSTDTNTEVCMCDTDYEASDDKTLCESSAGQVTISFVLISSMAIMLSKISS